MVAQLQRCPLFHDVPAALLRAELLPHGSVREYAKDALLFSPQERVEQLGVVLNGCVHLLHLFPDGSYSLMSALRPGRLLGAELICTGTRIAPYHAIAATPARVLHFPATLFLEPGTLPETLRQQLLRSLLRLLANQNVQKEYRLAILAQKGLRPRIITYLSMQAAKRNTNSFSIPFSREELAAFLCVNRSALSHELSRMQQEGLLTFRKNHFTLSEALLPQE